MGEIEDILRIALDVEICKKEAKTLAHRARVEGVEKAKDRTARESVFSRFYHHETTSDGTVNNNSIVWSCTRRRRARKMIREMEQFTNGEVRKFVDASKGNVNDVETLYKLVLTTRRDTR